MFTRFPLRRGIRSCRFRRLIFDSYYDAYKGVIVYVRIKEGTVHRGEVIRMMSTGAEFTVVEVRISACQPHGTDAICWRRERLAILRLPSKQSAIARVGDTVTLGRTACGRAAARLSKSAIRWCICGIYPADGAHYADLRDALEKLQLNDASLYL